MSEKKFTSILSLWAPISKTTASSRNEQERKVVESKKDEAKVHDAKAIDPREIFKDIYLDIEDPKRWFKGDKSEDLTVRSQQFSTIIDSALLGILTDGGGGKFEYSNERFERLSSRFDVAYAGFSEFESSSERNNWEAFFERYHSLFEHFKKHGSYPDEKKAFHI